MNSSEASLEFQIILSNYDVTTLFNTNCHQQQYVQLRGRLLSSYTKLLKRKYKEAIPLLESITELQLPMMHVVSFITIKDFETNKHVWSELEEVNKFLSSPFIL